MTAAPSRNTFHSLPSRLDDGTPAIQKSRSNVFEATPEFRDWFRRAFAAWLHENFTGPEHVAAVYGRRYQTALNWWNADNSASGDLVALVFMSQPAAVSFFLEQWEGARK